MGRSSSNSGNTPEPEERHVANSDKGPSTPPQPLDSTSGSAEQTKRSKKSGTKPSKAKPPGIPKKSNRRNTPLLPEFPAGSHPRGPRSVSDPAQPNPDRDYFAEYSPSKLLEIFAERDWMNVWERCERFADGECYILSIERHYDRSLALLAYHLKDSPSASEMDEWVENMLDKAAEQLLDEDDRDIPNLPTYAEPLLQEFKGDVQKAAAARRALNAEPHVVRAAFLHMGLDGISEFYFADLMHISPEQAREALARALRVSGYPGP